MCALLRPFVLLELCTEPTHGYELRKRLERLGFRIDSGAVYRLLRRLEDQGQLASSVDAAPGIGARRRTYCLTQSGFEQLAGEAESLDETAALVGSFATRYREMIAAGLRRERHQAVEASESSAPTWPASSGSHACSPSGEHTARGTPLEHTPLAEGAIERLRGAGIETLEEVALLGERKLLSHGLWAGDVRQIVAVLARSGLSLHPPSERDRSGREEIAATPDDSSDRSRAPRTPTLGERDAAIVAARAEGATLREIAQRFGVSGERVRQILLTGDAVDAKAAKAVRRARRRADAEGRRAEVVAAFRAGEPVGEVARRLGLPAELVFELVERHASAADRAARRLAQGNDARQPVLQGYTREALIDAVEQAARALGHAPKASEYAEFARESQLPSRSTVENRLGGWSAALVAAGLAAPRAGARVYKRRWSEEACLEALRALTAELGDFPSKRRYDELARNRGDLPSSATARNRLGSWPEIALRLADEAATSRG